MAINGISGPDQGKEVAQLKAVTASPKPIERFTPDERLQKLLADLEGIEGMHA